jgi:hypothetical protein
VVNWAAKICLDLNADYKGKHMRVVAAKRRDYKDKAIYVGHFRTDKQTIVEKIDDQLEPFGLETVMIDDGGSDLMWRVERRSEK